MRTSFFVSLFVSLVFASGASGATLNVGGGQLIGASEVDVGGTLYNVEFLDGSCIALFDGCDSASDFTFTSSVQATLAAQALLDQVFVDGDDGMFDTQPELTAGCHSHPIRPSLCVADTPWNVVDTVIRSINAYNYDVEVSDVTAQARSGLSFDWSRFGDITFAVWSPIPEPDTALLVAIGLAGLGWGSRTNHGKHS